MEFLSRDIQLDQQILSDLEPLQNQRISSKFQQTTCATPHCQWLFPIQPYTSPRLNYSHSDIESQNEQTSPRAQSELNYVLSTFHIYEHTIKSECYLQFLSYFQFSGLLSQCMSIFVNIVVIQRIYFCDLANALEVLFASFMAILLFKLVGKV